MQLLPQILDSVAGENRLEYRLRIDADLTVFEGHFPGFPILPGVVQIDWAIKLGRTLLAADSVFQSMHRIKFMRPITGDTHLQLALSTTPDGRNLTFKYYDDGHVYSSGRLLFAT